MKKLTTLVMVIICMAVLCAGCGDGRTDRLLFCIDTLANNHPDSALQILDSLKTEKPNWAKSQRMRYDMLQLKAENKAFVLLTSDSIAKELVNYYDVWGNANERLMAHYLLGCVYRDKEDSPRAIESYLNAITQADTTAKDCDYATLSATFSQMANIYHKQLLITDEINARKKANHYAYAANRENQALYEQKKIANALILINQKDSAESILKNIVKSYEAINDLQAALQASTSLIYLYTDDTSRLSDAYQLICKYDSLSDLFDGNHELPPSKRQYYYYKGRYFEGVNRLDSAEYYYRKVYRPNMSSVDKDPMYRGLLSVYTKRHQADSIAKYAQLFCEANDSSITMKDQELIAQMAATYNYSLFQKEAIENEYKANRSRIILLSFIFLVVFASFFFWKRYQRIKKQKQEEIERLKAEHVRATDEYSRNLYTMQLLDKARQREIESMQKDTIEYETIMDEIKEESRQLAILIKSIEQKKGISHFLDNTTNFMHTTIVRRLKKLENVPLSTMKEEDWTELEVEVRKYFPNLILDLHNAPKTTRQKMQVCMLVILKVPDSCIANWMDIKASRVSNIKSELNGMLFHDDSARTLCNNLRKKYNIISSEN